MSESLDSVEGGVLATEIGSCFAAARFAVVSSDS